MLSRRFFHFTKIATACSSVQSSSLAKLRKSTGYSMANCKKALQLHSDIQKAEDWLHEEAKKQGWSKIANLEHKTAAQGLIGVCVKDSIAAMVEVNCETDFVAKNIEFQSFVSKVLSSCLNHTLTHKSSDDYAKLLLDSNSLNGLPSENSTLGDLVATAIGKFGEKTVIRRAVCFKVGNNIKLSSFCHPLMVCPDIGVGNLGKYGGLVAFSPKITTPEMTTEFLSDVGRQLCQHIVGMNPTTLGKMEDIKPLAKNLEISNEEFGAKVVSPDQREDIILNDNPPSDELANEESESKDYDNEVKLVDANENRLIHQQFLLDPSICVGEFLLKHSIEISDFQRFECGEIIN